MEAPIHIISLGGGVQSSAMALKAARREISPMPVAAIFSDTQSEPASVMAWLDYLEPLLPFPVYRVTNGNLETDELRIRTSAKSGKRYLKGSIPAFVLAPDGKKGLLGRKCTGDYKIIPLQKKIRELVGIKRQGQGVVRAKVWIGISTDEAHRMKPSRVDYIENVFPLIDAGMSRNDCLAWMERMGYPKPPRSACYFCPFHSNLEWRNMKAEHDRIISDPALDAASVGPSEWQRAVQFELAMQEAQRNQEVLRGIPFLHSSCVTIDKADIAEKNKGYEQLSMFGNECEGMCGV